MKSDETHNTVRRRYDRFVERMRANDPMAAAEEFARLCQALRRTDLKVPDRAVSAFWESWIDLFWQGRHHDLMLRAADEAIELLGSDPVWLFARGEALFNMARFEESAAVLEPLTHEDFEEPMLYYLLACLAERRGETTAAARLFQTANRLDPKGFAVPVTIEEGAALEFYEGCMKELPTPILSNIKDVPVFVSALPSDEMIRSFTPPMDPLVLGVFLGQSRGEASTPWASDQPRILLFHANIAKLADDFETLEDELRKTLFHEVGHYLGFSEEELEEMGLA
jgi:predicted Zn-dependent protease with MMP-like domain